MAPPYNQPGKCEGQTKNPEQTLGRYDTAHGTMRCQETENLTWHEGAYAWLCPKHVRGANRRKAT